MRSETEITLQALRMPQDTVDSTALEMGQQVREELGYRAVPERAEFRDGLIDPRHCFSGYMATG